MQIVIDIPEWKYISICEGIEASKRCGVVGTDHNIHEAIANGTPLPKGHGALKDEDKIIRAIEDRVEFLRKNDAVFMRLRKDIDILGCIPKIRCEVPTIVEADKEGE